jgi:hypothetical protein
MTIAITQEQHLLNEALRSIEALRADVAVLDARIKKLETDALTDHSVTGPTPPTVVYPYYPQYPPWNPWSPPLYQPNYIYSQTRTGIT